MGLKLQRWDMGKAAGKARKMPGAAGNTLSLGGGRSGDKLWLVDSLIEIIMDSPQNPSSVQHEVLLKWAGGSFFKRTCKDS